MQQSLDFKTIEEITEKIIDYRGKTPPKTNKGIKLITAKVIKDGYILDGEHEYISEATYPEWMTRGFPQKGDVLITTEAPLGEVALLRTSEKIALAQRVILLRGKPNLIDQTYYMYALKTSFVQEQLRARSVSTTVAGIKQSDLVEVKIPLLPLEEQKRIASIAQKCDRLRRTRRYTQQLSDSYLRSVFLEMFGDPVTNPMGWDECVIEELCEVIVDCPHTTPIYSTSITSFPCIRTSDLQDGFLDWATTKYVELSEYTQRTKRYKPVYRDVLYSREGERFGIAAIVPKFVMPCLGQRMMLLKANSKLANNEFLWGLMNSKAIYQQALNLVGGSTSPHVNVRDIKEFKAFIPTLSLQEKFAQIVQRFERLRMQQREGDRQAEHLFQTILHRAFRGEL